MTEYLRIRSYQVPKAKRIDKGRSVRANETNILLRYFDLIHIQTVLTRAWPGDYFVTDFTVVFAITGIVGRVETSIALSGGSCGE